MDTDLAAPARCCITCHQPVDTTAADPLSLPGLDGPLVGALDVTPGFVPTPHGRAPVLRFQFTGPTPDGGVRALPPINLLMDANTMRDLRPMIAGAIDQAIIGARRGH